jgi:hypothetical protein
LEFCPVRTILLAALLSLVFAAPSTASVRILASPGGQIGQYLKLFAMVRASGEKVIIDGPCFSACTLVLSVVPNERICVTRKAILGFHAAWMPDPKGRPLTAVEATKLMLRTYPRPVQSWIKRNGGLTRKAILLRGRELSSMYPRCA